MGSRRVRGAGGFALGAGLRAVAISALALAVALAARQHLYATGVVLAGVAILVGLDLVRSTTAADRVLAQFVDGLAAEGYERPTPPTGLRRLAQAMDRALDRLAGARAERQGRVDFLEALADTVPAALLVVDDTGAVVGLNRAARLNLGGAAGPLAAIPALPPDAARRLLALPAGAREIVRLKDNTAALAHVAVFSTPGQGRRRLISLQGVSAELDAVELKAWQDLVRVLAHEMMNSLTPICSLSESIAGRLREPGGRADTADIAEAVEVIARRSAGLMSFVERYRRLADLPAAARTKVAMAEVVKRLDRLMAPMLDGAGIDYASTVTPRALTLQADPDLLEQAMINLLKNAVDAVRGRPDAAIRLACRLEDGQVEIVVEDNGPGLPAEDPEAAFVPFFTTKPGGSGVGLTLSRQIALAHGGRIEHQPRVPQGAVFKLVLPAG